MNGANPRSERLRKGKERESGEELEAEEGGGVEASPFSLLHNLSPSSIASRYLSRADS
jgi:hypothetical protein